MNSFPFQEKEKNILIFSNNIDCHTWFFFHYSLELFQKTNRILQGMENSNQKLKFHQGNGTTEFGKNFSSYLRKSVKLRSTAYFDGELLKGTHFASDVPASVDNYHWKPISNPHDGKKIYKRFQQPSRMTLRNLFVPVIACWRDRET